MTTSARELRSPSPRATFEIARELASQLPPGAVIGLNGPLGAGKTLFVQGLAAGLGVEDPQAVRSPTFVLMMEHELPGGGLLVHLDAYRLQGEAEFADLGLEDLLDGRNVVVVEWSDRVREALPDRLIGIEFSLLGETERRLRLTGDGEFFFAPGAEPGPSGPVEST